MGIQIGDENSVSGVGWYLSGFLSAREVLEEAAEGNLAMQPDRPITTREYGDDLFKITITVEKQ